MGQAIYHPAFPQTGDPNVSLWRYMDAEKFRWLVEYGRLFMPNAENLGEDTFEGTTPDGDLAWWHQQAEQAESEEQRRTILHNCNLVSGFANKFRNKYYVSCWHLNQNENPTMWDSYTNSPESVVIRTTFSTLRSCLPPYALLGRVTYIDYDTDRLRSINLFERITHKRKQYAVENEVRAVVFHPPDEASNSKHFQENLYEFEDNSGRRVFIPPINVKQLTLGVAIHPKAPPDFVSEVERICRDNGLVQPETSLAIL